MAAEGTTLDVINPSRWADVQGSQCSSSKLNSLCQDCWNQFVPKMQKPGSLAKSGEVKRLKPASKACSGHAGERSGLVLPFTSQQRGTLSDAGGLGTMASPLVPAAQALEEATRPPHRRKDILRTASKPGAPRCVPQEPRSFILSRFSGAQSERASAGRFWVQLTLLGPSTVPGVDVADVLGAELARVARGGAAGRACVWCLLA